MPFIALDAYFFDNCYKLQYLCMIRVNIGLWFLLALFLGRRRNFAGARRSHRAATLEVARGLADRSPPGQPQGLRPYRTIPSNRRIFPVLLNYRRKSSI